MKPPFRTFAARLGRLAWTDALIYALLAATVIGVTARLAWRNTLPRTAFQYRNCPYERHTLLTAGQFKVDGFLNSFFLPFDAPDDYYMPMTYWVYPHIPPFAEVFFGAMHVLGVNTTHGLRWFSIFLNAAALVVLFAAMSLLKDRVFALLVILATVLNPLFWMRAHGLYEYAFGVPHQALLLLGLALYARTKSAAGLALAFLGAFWQGACTVVFQLETYFIILGFLFTGPRRDRAAYFFVALAGPLSFAAHVVQVGLLDGSFVRAFNDLFASYQQKSVAVGPYVKSVAAFHRYRSFGEYAQHMAQYLATCIGVRRYLLLSIALTFAALAGAAVRRYDASARANLARVAFLFVGSWLWFFAMPEVVLVDTAPAMYSITLWLALSVAVPLYAVGALAKRLRLKDALWAAPLIVAGGYAALLLWQNRLEEMKTYFREDRQLLATLPEAPPGLAESVWWVGASDGLRGGEWLMLFGAQTPGEEEYYRRPCRADDPPECASAEQGLRFFFWNVVAPRAPAIRLTCARPGDTRVAFYDVGIYQVKGRLLGETRVDNFAGGWLEVPVPAPTAGRVFVLEIGPAACASYVIDRVTLQ